MAAKRVTLYTMAKCPHCQTAKRYLDSEGIRYRLCDVTSAKGRKEAQMLGIRGVPAVKVGEQLLRSFSVKSFQQAYR